MRLYIIQSLKLGTRSFVRNGSLVFLTIVAIIGIQMVFMAGLFGKAVFGYALSALERRVDARLSLVATASDTQINQLVESIRALPHVSDVQKVESQDIYASFQDRHADDFLTLQALKELSVNPFGDEIIVKLDTPSYYNEFFRQLTSPDILPGDLVSLIEDTDTVHNDVLVDRLAKFEHTASNIATVLVIVAFLVVVVVLSVVSRLFLSQYSRDIAVMRTFGVSESHIGAWLCVTYSICIVLATAISMLCISGIFSAFDAYMASLSAGLSLSAWFHANILGVVGFVFFVSLAIVHLVTMVFLSLHKSNPRSR